MNNTYELYIPKKKKGTPNEDYPCNLFFNIIIGFGHTTILSKTN